MKLWMKRISVFLITFMTLGMYTPPIDLNANTENKEIISEKMGTSDEMPTPIMEVEQEQSLDLDSLSDHVVKNTDDYIIEMITEQAKERTIAKLGPRIVNKIEPEITTTIMPNMEDVLHMIFAEAGEEKINYYGIAESPGAGYGERIFNIHDYDARKDVVRFDVRRENRPGDGYWFNFHYHLSDDGFEEHHHLGEVYWDKNTPPKWMA